MNLALFAISVLLVMAAWAAKNKTALDRVRDDLFDLRDEVREKFLALPEGLNHPLYRALRDHINNYIRFAENLRFTGMVWFSVNVPQDILAEIDRRMNARYATGDAELAGYVKEIRSRSVHIMQEFMLITSLCAMMIVAVAIPVLIVQAVKKETKLAFGTIREYMKRQMDRHKYTSWQNIEAAAQAAA